MGVQSAERSFSGVQRGKKYASVGISGAFKPLDRFQDNAPAALLILNSGTVSNFPYFTQRNALLDGSLGSMTRGFLSRYI